MSKISVIIPTFNSDKCIKPCLNSISAQDYHDFEVIVVDNGSSDNTVSIIKADYPHVILIENKENLGACKARNQGIEISQGEWIMTLDCDVILKKDFLNKIISFAKKSQYSVGMFQPKILNIDKKTIYSCGIACSVEGEQTPAGNYQVNLLLANVCKLNVTRFPYELARLATDIAGGLLGTMPSASDVSDPVAGEYIRKYLAATPGVEVLDRIKVLRLIENLVAGAGAVGYLIESMHGAGPPTAQRIMIGRQADLESKVARVKTLLGTKSG